MKVTADEIRAATLKALDAEGASSVSMRRIAARVGITPMAIYHHFPSRAALLQSVVDGEFAGLEAGFQREKLSGDLEADLARFAGVYLRYASRHPRIFDYMFAEPRRGARRFPGDFRAGRSPTLNRVAEIMAAGMESGAFRRADVWELAMHFWALVHGYTMLRRAGRFRLSEKSFRSLVQRSVSCLIRGLQAAPLSAPPRR
ncbi:MAG TPA: TetR/AcrR family transcriptional regulator [Opitutaceae bacterium]|nr:TetR/AcrR family transcriptional regulator [Opitutaceae bacterium]